MVYMATIDHTKASAITIITKQAASGRVPDTPLFSVADKLVSSAHLSPVVAFPKLNSPLQFCTALALRRAFPGPDEKLKGVMG